MSFLLVSCDNRQTKSLLQDVETYIQERPDSAAHVQNPVFEKLKKLSYLS